MKIIFLILFSTLLLTFSNQVLAVNTAISNTLSSITDEPFTFNVSITGAQTGTNYLRADLYQSGTYNYFGFTFNGTDYYNGSIYNQFLPIIINSEGSASATIQAKIDSSSSSFKGSGPYKLKVRRYTSQNSYTWSNEASLDISYDLPTSTPIPASTPTPTDTPDPTNTPTPIKTPTPTKTSTPAPTIKPTTKPSPTSTSDNPNLPASILGTSSATVMPTISQDSVKNQSSVSPLTKIFLIGGMIILLLSGGLFYTFLAKRKQEQV